MKSEDNFPTRSTPSSYREIIRSSAVIGFSTVLTVLFGIFRAKTMALLLGPVGFGISAIYISILDLLQSFFGMGINSSGVRQIAAAAANSDSRFIAETSIVLRRCSWGLGALGAAVLVLCARPISKLSFGTEQYVLGTAILGAALILRLIASGQAALLQGLRRVSELAWISILSGLFGTIATILLVYFFRVDGVAPSLVIVAAVTVFVSCYFTRRANLPPVQLSTQRLKEETIKLLDLGFVFMATTLLTVGTGYVVRIIVREGAGLEAAGLYQAAWTVGGLYVGFVLQAMGSDFYPRLTGAIENPAEANRLVNEQAHASLLMAGPGILATLAFSEIAINLLYSTKFAAAVPTLRWICLGMALRIITWPIGFIIVAKGSKTWLIFTEAAWTAVHLGLAWILVSFLGLAGAGIAFFASYIIHGLIVYPIVNRLVGFRWSTANIVLALQFFFAIALVFISSILFSCAISLTINSALFLITSIYCFQRLSDLLGPEHLPKPFRFLNTFLRSFSR